MRCSGKGIQSLRRNGKSAQCATAPEPTSVGSPWDCVASLALLALSERHSATAFNLLRRLNASVGSNRLNGHRRRRSFDEGPVPIGIVRIRRRERADCVELRHLLRRQLPTDRAQIFTQLLLVPCADQHSRDRRSLQHPVERDLRHRLSRRGSHPIDAFYALRRSICAVMVCRRSLRISQSTNVC